MKVGFGILTAWFCLSASFAQPVCNEFFYRKFSREELSADADFIRTAIRNAHINPFTEISEAEFEANFSTIKAQIKDGMTQRDFYFLISPVIVKLNDEHAGLNDFCITDSIKANFKVFPLRFRYEGDKVLLTENYSGEALETGDELLSINAMPIAEITDSCSRFVFGIAEERKAVAIAKLWLYLPKFCYFITDDYRLRFASGKEVLIKSQSWETFNGNYSKQHPVKNAQKGNLQYEKIANSAYLTVNSFDDPDNNLDKWKQQIDSVFTKIRQQKVTRLFIDVSNNGGGNSAIGNMLIDYFSNKSYKDYSGKWKKSQEYSDFMARHNIKDAVYETMQNGAIMNLPSETIKPSANKNRFNGKTFVVIGKNTFSSAMMFATIVSDNKLATLIGETPERGHPNHFGELIYFKAPNSQLVMWFGVKEWIRPLGKGIENRLVPDIPLSLVKISAAEIIAKIK